MDNLLSRLESLASAYAVSRGIAIAFDSPLGFGTDGRVWRTSRKSAIKVFERESNYVRERDCYRHLKSLAISNIEGFAIPRLIDSDDELLVVEMDIVSPPFLLDFAKAYLEGPPDFSIHNGDSAAVEDVRFENIRVEDARDKLVDFRVGLSIYSQDCPERYHRRNPQRKPTGAGQWVPWASLTAEEQAVARQNRGAIRNVRSSDIQLLEKVPPRSFLVNSGGELSGVTFQNLRQDDRVLANSEHLGLSVEGATEVRFAR